MEPRAIRGGLPREAFSIDADLWHRRLDLFDYGGENFSGGDFSSGRNLLWVHPDTPQLITRGDLDAMGHDVVTLGSAQFKKWNGSAWVNDGTAISLTCMMGGMLAEHPLLRHWLPLGDGWESVLPWLPIEITLPGGWRNTCVITTPYWDSGAFVYPTPTITDQAGYTCFPLADLLPTGGAAVNPRLVAVRSYGVAKYDILKDQYVEPSIWLYFDGPIIPGSGWSTLAGTAIFTRSDTAYLEPVSWYHDAKFPNVVRVRVKGVVTSGFEWAAKFKAITISAVNPLWVTAADGTAIGSASVVITDQRPGVRFAPQYGPGYSLYDGSKRMSQMVDSVSGSASDPTIWDDDTTTQRIGTIAYQLPSTTEDPHGASVIDTPTRTHQFNPWCDGNIFTRGTSAVTGKSKSAVAWVEGIVGEPFDVVADGPSYYPWMNEWGSEELLPNAYQSIYDIRKAFGVKLAAPLPEGYSLDAATAPAGGSILLRVFHVRTQQAYDVQTNLSPRGGSIGSFLIPPSTFPYQIATPRIGNNAPTGPPLSSFLPEDKIKLKHMFGWLPDRTFWYIYANAVIKSMSHSFLWVYARARERATYEEWYTSPFIGVNFHLSGPAIQPDDENGLAGDRYGWQVGDRVLIPVYHDSVRTASGLHPVHHQPNDDTWTTAVTTKRDSSTSRTTAVQLYSTRRSWDELSFLGGQGGTLYIYEAVNASDTLGLCEPDSDYFRGAPPGGWITPSPPTSTPLIVPAEWTLVQTISIAGADGTRYASVHSLMRPALIYIHATAPATAFTSITFYAGKTPLPVALHDLTQGDRVVPGKLLPGNDNVV